MNINTSAPSLNNASPSSRLVYDLYCGRRNRLDIKCDGTTLYHLTIHDQGGEKPDLILRRGGNAQAPGLAMSKIQRSSKAFSVYVGDEQKSTSDDWSAVRCIPTGTGMGASNLFYFTYRQAGSSERAFHWTKSREKDLGASKWTGRDLKLVDEGSGEVLAVYHDRMGMHAVGQRGHVEWRGQSCDEQVRVYALIVLFSILERKSRSMRAVLRALSPGRGSGGLTAAA